MTRSESQSGIGKLARLFKGRDSEAGDSEPPASMQSVHAAPAQEAAPTAASPVAPATEADPDKILNDLRCWAAAISDEGFTPDELDPDASIFDEGYVDSMSYVELLARVEERYGVAVPDERVAGSSLSELATYIAEEFAA